jgi:bla regulator protein BlaR1
MFVGQSNFLQALGWAVLNSLWQMAFLWVIYQVISSVYRSAKSSQKSYLATGLILIGFTWFIYTFCSILLASPANVISADFISANGNERLNAWMSTMLPIASVTYLVLLLLPVFYFVHNYRYVQNIRNNELSKVDVDWRIFVKNVAARMGIKKPVRIWLSGIVTSPVTIGYLKPVILLPVAAINQLSTQQLEAVLLHELAHIRRYDYLVNLIIRCIQTILYFNPFVKALVKTVEMEREKSCDEMVMQFQYDPHGYATALLMLEKISYLPRPLAVAAAGRKSDLLNRIECLLGVQKKQVISFNKVAGLFAGLLCFIAVNALLIANKPGKATGDIASLTDMSSALYFFTESEKGTKDAKPILVPQETIAKTIVNHARPVETKAAAQNATTAPETVTEDLALAEFKFAKLVEPSPDVPAIKELKAYQEQQVKEALAASKKILEQKQWKDVEKTIADAMTEQEKDILKCQYEKELSKVDWTKMKQKLSLAYDKIDWPAINDNLNSALIEIKIDSLQQVYVQTMTELSTVQNELRENNLKAIPDTDVSLESIEQNKSKVLKALNTLHNVKARKIIHL